MFSFKEILTAGRWWSIHRVKPTDGWRTWRKGTCPSSNSQMLITFER